ncbi:MAG: hypothetical protein R3F20_06045 [Planctomycetota bacterium]
MRIRRFVVASAALCALVAMFWTGSGRVETVQANDYAADTQSAFELEIELSQVNKTLVLALRDGQPNALGALEVTTFYRAGGALQSASTLVPLMLNPFGEYQVVLPLVFDPVVTDYEMHISAFHVSSTGQYVHVHTPWRFGSMLVNQFSDLATISPVASAMLAGANDDDAADDSTSSPLATLGITADGLAPSFAFVSQTTAPDGSFVLTGPGNYMAAGTPSQFSLTSGPAGVFTAN